MMKNVTVLLLAILGSALAAPAIVWKNGEQQSEAAVRTSKQLQAFDLLSDVLSADPESSSVVFLLERGADGSESLSTMAASGFLPNVEAKYNNANAIHHHVAGVESRDSMVRDVKASSGRSAMLISLGELGSKLSAQSENAELPKDGVINSKAEKYAHKRAKDMAAASVLIVNVAPSVDGTALDSAIINAIEHDGVSSVVLTAVRSHAEVKQERLLHNNRRLSMLQTEAKSAHGRRLEQENGDDNQQQDNNDDMSGVYYVSMTPNILAGILFTLMFATVVFIGVTCMGAIQGQPDIYAKKLPPVGREA